MCDTNVESKVCSCCNTEQPVSNFTRHKQCKKCIAEKAKMYRSKIDVVFKSRVCSKCGEEKSSDLFSQLFVCKLCKSEFHKEYYKKNIAKIKIYREGIDRIKEAERVKRYTSNLSDERVSMRREYQKEYKLKNKEKIKCNIRKYEKEKRDHLYLKYVLKNEGLKKEDVPNDLKDAIIAIGKAKRELKIK